MTDHSMTRTTRYIARYREHLVALLVEDFLGWLVRGLPGPLGLSLRHAVLSLTCRRAGGFRHIYPGVYILHSYGLSFGRELSVNTGVHIDARGGLTIGDHVVMSP